MIVHTTLNGQVTDRSPDPAHMNATLWDFDVDAATLKSNHRGWLDSVIQRVNASNRALFWNVSTTGCASLTGVEINHNRHNADLAMARAEVVTKYIKDRLEPRYANFDPPFSASTIFAGLAKHAIGVENDNDRCALVMVTTDTVPPPLPPKPTSIPVSREWALKFMSGGSVSFYLPVGVESALYDIADLKNNIHAIFEFRGDIVAGGLPINLLPFSVTGEGDWQTFSTNDAIHVSDFDGPAQFTSAGIGPISKNYLRLTPKGGATTIPTPLVVETGFTFGVGATVTVPKTGWLNLKSRASAYSGRFPP